MDEGEMNNHNLYHLYTICQSQLTQVIRRPCYLHFQPDHVMHSQNRKASHELTLRLQLMRSDQGSVEMH